MAILIIPKPLLRYPYRFCDLRQAEIATGLCKLNWINSNL